MSRTRRNPGRVPSVPTPVGRFFTEDEGRAHVESYTRIGAEILRELEVAAMPLRVPRAWNPPEYAPLVRYAATYVRSMLALDIVFGDFYQLFSTEARGAATNYGVTYWTPYVETIAWPQRVAKVSAYGVPAEFLDDAAVPRSTLGHPSTDTVLRAGAPTNWARHRTLFEEAAVAVEAHVETLAKQLTTRSAAGLAVVASLGKGDGVAREVGAALARHKAELANARALLLQAIANDATFANGGAFRLASPHAKAASAALATAYAELGYGGLGRLAEATRQTRLKFDRGAASVRSLLRKPPTKRAKP